MSGRDLIEKIRPTVQEVSIRHVFKNLERDAVIIDIREKDEFSFGWIEGALNIPRGILETNLQKIPQVASAENPLVALFDYKIYLYCRSGARSVLSAESLQRLGYQNVYSMAGGIVAWKNAGFPISH